MSLDHRVLEVLAALGEASSLEIWYAVRGLDPQAFRYSLDSLHIVLDELVRSGKVSYRIDQAPDRPGQERRIYRKL